MCVITSNKAIKFIGFKIYSTQRRITRFHLTHNDFEFECECVLKYKGKSIVRVR